MVSPVIRIAAWMLTAVATLFTLSGCNNDPFEVQLVNEGIYPITEVLLYPVLAGCEASGPEAQVNRLPKDDSGATMALLPKDETTPPVTKI